MTHLLSWVLATSRSGPGAEWLCGWRDDGLGGGEREAGRAVGRKAVEGAEEWEPRQFSAEGVVEARALEGSGSLAERVDEGSGAGGCKG